VKLMNDNCDNFNDIQSISECELIRSDPTVASVLRRHVIWCG
jgi:hypothetical protein